MIKKNMMLLTSVIFLLSCNNNKNISHSNLTSISGDISINGWGRKLNIKEFDYKGHTYIMIIDGDNFESMSTCHAGHCWCQTNKLINENKEVKIKKSK